MSNGPESSKKASKRSKVEKLSIEAALRNNPNSGIYLVQRDEEVDKLQSKGKPFKGDGSSKKLLIDSDGESSEENSSEGDFPKDYSSEDASNESSSDDDFPISKMYEKTKSLKKELKTKTNNTSKKKAKLTSFFSSEESSEEESSKEDKDTNVKDLSNEDFGGRDVNDRNELSESNLPSTEESHKSRKSKGISRPSALEKIGGSRMKVQFNDRGQPIGEASVRFSSVLGSIAAEMVPLTCCDWRSVHPKLKACYWLTVQQKFILDEGRKEYTLQQIGKLWRAHKSRLRKKIRVCKSRKEIKEAKPKGVAKNEWIIFAKEVFKRSFVKKSKKFREMRATQDLPHTCSRKGYARLEDEMKKESSNPDSITRVDVWAKGHLKKDGTPSNNTVSETLEKIREYRESVASSQGVSDDALSKVLGPERCGRVRGVGSGVAPSKLGSVSQNKSHVKQLQEEVGTLKEQMARQTELIQKLMEVVQVQQGGNVADLGTPRLDVSSLSENRVKQCRNTTQVSKVQQGGNITDLGTPRLDVSSLSENRVKQCRNTTQVSKVQCVEIEPTQHKSEPRATSNPHQSSSPPQARENANMVGKKCKLMNWSVAEEIVAIGRWDTDAPDTMVHSICLGENASRVWVDDVINGSAPLWRVNSLMQTVADAKGSTVAWPNKSIIFDDGHS